MTTLCVTGCSRNVAPDAVSSIDLRNGLADQVAKSGASARSIDCPKPLAARVGATARCDVIFSASDAVTALLTTTEVVDGKANWEITQIKLTKDQVVKRLAAITGAKNIECDSGVDGQPGSWVACRSTDNGASLNESVEVTEVKGLQVKLKATPFMSEDQLLAKVQDKLTALYGSKPDITKCKGDLTGIVGKTVDCVSTVDNTPEKWLVTVTGVSGGSIDIDISSPSRGISVGGADKCIGCPG